MIEPDPLRSLEIGAGEIRGRLATALARTVFTDKNTLNRALVPVRAPDPSTPAWPTLALPYHQARADLCKRESLGLEFLG